MNHSFLYERCSPFLRKQLRSWPKQFLQELLFKSENSLNFTFSENTTYLSSCRILLSIIMSIRPFMMLSNISVTVSNISTSIISKINGLPNLNRRCRTLICKLLHTIRICLKTKKLSMNGLGINQKTNVNKTHLKIPPLLPHKYKLCHLTGVKVALF